FDRQYYYAIYSYYHDNFKVLNNTITTNSTNTYFYGTYLYYNDNLDVIGNEMSYSGSKNYLYGLYIYQSNNPASQYGLVKDNKIDFTNTHSSGYVYPHYFYYMSNDSIINNDFKVRSNYYSY